MERCAWWIVSLLRRCERSEKKTLAYVGRQDVRYAVLMLGAVKEGGSIRFVLSASEKKKKLDVGGKECVVKENRLTRSHARASNIPSRNRGRILPLSHATHRL